MAAVSAALGCIAPSSLAIVNSQGSSLQRNNAAASSSSCVSRTRATIKGSSFLGVRVAPQSSRTFKSSAFESRSLIAEGGGVRSFMGSPSGPKTRNVSGRIIFTPFGPVITSDSGPRSQAWREREKERIRAQQAKFRKMIEGQMRNRMMDQRSLQDRDMMLLRELERRLRAAAAQGDTTHQTDIDELIKNLEGRLRPMKENIENETTEREKTSPEQPGYSTTYDYLNSWLKGWDHCLKEEELRLRKQRKETKNEQQPGVSSDRDVKSEGSASTSKEPCEAKTEDSSTTLKEKDHVKNSSEQPDVIRGDSSTTLKEDDQVYTPQDLDVKAENSSSDLKEQDQVYTPEMIQEIEDKKKRLLEEEFKKQNVERKKAEAPNSKQAPSDGTVVYLRNEENGADLYLVGTSHVSQQSADEVRDVIRRVKPDYVLVELDRKRYNSMLQRQNGQNNPFAFVQQMVETLTNNNIGAVGKVLGLGLSGFYWLLAYWGLQPGQEFKVAIQEGKKAGAKIVLGDQDIDVTLKHFGEQTSVAEALQFFAQPMPSDIAQKMSGTTPRAPRQMEFEQLRDRKLVRQLNEEMEKKAPALTNILLRERNESMTKALRNLSGKVVAVVGLAHLDGIEQLWREANEKYLNSTE